VPGIGDLDHTSFTVSSVDRSVAFYRDLLGCELLSNVDEDGGPLPLLFGYDEASIRVALLRPPAGAHVIELIEFRAPPSTLGPIEPRAIGAAHLCFAVGDLEAEYERLRAAGVDSFVSPPVSGEARDGGRWSALFLRDPDGILVELYQLPPV
jgi:lactoylglutathione lyase